MADLPPSLRRSLLLQALVAGPRPLPGSCNDQAACQRRLPMIPLWTGSTGALIKNFYWPAFHQTLPLCQHLCSMSSPLRKPRELEKRVSTAGLLGNVCLLVASDPGGEILRLDGGVGPTGGAARGGCCCSAGLISGPPSLGKANRMEYKYRIESWIF